ncbi:MAG: RHS repeat-associated core domain-containing protein, partial [Coriobacteriia bacterium]|nr:RHS repeat-associated core domain-containing protein [Coriobacteriia bacterium]
GGYLTALLTPGGDTHTFGYTAKGARKSWTLPDGATYGYTFDTERRPTSVTAPSGSRLEFSYADGFTSGVTFDGGSIEQDRAPCGRLDALTRASERTIFAYDGWLKTSETRTGEATATLAWTYNADMAPSAFTYAGGTQTYAYDDDGGLVSAAPFAIERSAEAGLPTRVSAPGIELARTFSTYGELDASALSVAGSPTYSYSLARDVAGRITQRTSTDSDGSASSTYAYDALGRLTAVSRGGTLLESYSYDADGNRTAYRAPVRGIEDTVTVALSGAGHTLASGEMTAIYDIDGYLTTRTSSEGTSTFAFSALGGLAGVTLPDGREISYVYDGAGLRVAKRIDGVVAERYLWADATRLLAVMDGEGELVARFTYADARTPNLMETPAGTFSLAYDQVGTLTGVVDEDGTVVKRVVRDSFGVLVADSNPGFRVAIGFAGGLEDADTGLVLFGARDYDPELGRWTSRDPIDFGGGDSNLYAYCGGDPVSRVDPSGLMTFGSGFGVSFAWVVGGVDFSVMLVGDDAGNLGLAFSAGGHAGLAVGTSGYVQWQGTGARTIYDPRGPSGSGGGSAYAGPGGGFERVSGGACGSEYSGLNLQLGAGAGAEAHVGLSNSWVVGVNLTEPIALAQERISMGGYDIGPSRTVSPPVPYSTLPRPSEEY